MDGSVIPFILTFTTIHSVSQCTISQMLTIGKAPCLLWRTYSENQTRLVPVTKELVLTSSFAS